MSSSLSVFSTAANLSYEQDVSSWNTSSLEILFVVDRNRGTYCVLHILYGLGGT